MAVRRGSGEVATSAPTATGTMINELRRAPPPEPAAWEYPAGHDERMALTVAEGNAILKANFAPWVQDLGLVVEEIGPGHATLRLPKTERLAREGGALSGQALMAAADTATVIAISGARGNYGPMTTVQQSISFQRSVVDADVLVTATVTKLGRTLACASVSMTPDGAP
jgi:uncharacterized protein (TIGR00369 family)